MNEQAWRVLSRLSWQKVVEIAVLTIFFFLLLVVISVVDRTGAFGYSGFNFRIEHVVIAAVPLVILLLILGYLEEIQGPMGVSLSLQNEAARTIEPQPRDSRMNFIAGPKVEKGAVETGATIESGSITTEGERAVGERNEEQGFSAAGNIARDLFVGDWDELDQEEREHLNRLAEVYRVIEDIDPVVLSFELGNQGYDITAIDDYMTIIRRYPSVQYILFIKPNQKFAGLMSVDDFRDFLYSMWTELIKSIESGTILDDPRVTTEAVGTEATNYKALQRMNKVNHSTLAVVDGNNNFRGIISQEQIIRDVLIALFEEA
jgi:CBS domain-containing protein